MRTFLCILCAALWCACVVVALLSHTQPSAIDRYVGQQPVPQVRDVVLDVVREVCDAIRSTGHPEPVKRICD